LDEGTSVPGVSNLFCAQNLHLIERCRAACRDIGGQQRRDAEQGGDRVEFVSSENSRSWEHVQRFTQQVRFLHQEITSIVEEGSLYPAHAFEHMIAAIGGVLQRT
jgi:hypothetical protein